jgi:hypothetical protein
MDSSTEWLLKRKHEDISQTFRVSWDLYIRFYTVFLTFSVAGLGWMLTQQNGLSSMAKQVIAVVFLLQTALTAITSGIMAQYSVDAVRDQREIEATLLGETGQPTKQMRSAIPRSLARWSGWANCAAMAIMGALWVYVGWYR